MTRGKIEYPGHYLNGKTLPVACRRDYLGVLLVVVLDGDQRIGLPADKVRVFEVPGAGGEE